MSAEIDSFVALALRLCAASAPIIRRHFRTSIAVDDKADASPVTVADRDAEAAMRHLIETEFPDHGILGEEFGATRPEASHLWVLDPIDGTKSFVTGRPLFGTLIGLVRDGRPIVGVIDCPALGERWLGAQGRPTLHQDREARVRPCGDLGQAWLYNTSPNMFGPGDFARFERVRRAVKFPIYGGDCYGYGLMASGYCDLVIEAGLKPHDWAALAPVIEGAGGRITDWENRPLVLDGAVRVLASGDARVHDAALRLLGG